VFGLASLAASSSAEGSAAPPSGTAPASCAASLPGRIVKTSVSEGIAPSLQDARPVRVVAGDGLRAPRESRLHHGIAEQRTERLGISDRLPVLCMSDRGEQPYREPDR
jgi:hypothetical protein